MNLPVVVILGPTASGKSAVAQLVAERIGGEIVSADSMQVYRFMDIGTAKTPVAERTVAYYGIDLVDPDVSYSAALYQSYARDAFKTIAEAGGWPMLVGGTGLYIRAALDDLAFAPDGAEQGNLRDELQAFADREGDQALWDRLAAIDAESAALIHPHNVRRVIRAFEMHATGESYAKRKDAFSTQPPVIPSIKFGLRVSPEKLRERIDKRVDAMIDEGLIDEVKSLLNRGFRHSLTAKQAIGYKELIAAIDGELDYEEAIGAIKVATRRLAKRQRTWFQRDPSIHWLDADRASAETLAQTIVDELKVVQDPASRAALRDTEKGSDS